VEVFMRIRRFGVPFFAAAATLFVVTAWADAPDSGTSAVWTPKELRFTYMGFTSHYSCDGLRDKILSTLRLLGARDDLKVTEYGCPGGFGRPSAFPSVSIKASVLTPADPKSSDAGALVPAHWQSVDLTASRDPLDVAGDCELIEQIKQRILPLFTSRNVDYQSTCIPNQLEVGGTRLKAQVLVADKPAKP
jgi:hypothetical protein